MQVLANFLSTPLAGDEGMPYVAFDLNLRVVKVQSGLSLPSPLTMILTIVIVEIYMDLSI